MPLSPRDRERYIKQGRELLGPEPVPTAYLLGDGPPGDAGPRDILKRIEHGDDIELLEGRALESVRRCDFAGAFDHLMRLDIAVGRVLMNETRLQEPGDKRGEGIVDLRDHSRAFWSELGAAARRCKCKG